MNPLHNALTPPALVLAGLRGAIASEIPNLSFVFDPSLTWGEAAKSQRAARYMQIGTPEEGTIPDQGSNPTQYPLMAWNRSVLLPMVGKSRRNAFNAYAEVPAAMQQWDIQLFQGEMHFSFKIYSRDVLELEAIEMGYVAKSLISDITEFSIPLDALYPPVNNVRDPTTFWPYEVVWDPLQEELDIQRLPNMLFALQGTATVRGNFLTGAVSPLYLINTIDLTLMDMNQTVLESVIVTRGQ